MTTSALKKRIDNIREKGGIKSREVAQLLDTTPQTVSRWQTGQASPQPKSLERLLTLEWLADQLSQFYQPDEARLWLFSRHALLSGARPADLIAVGRTDEILRLIDQLQSGAYT
ncbi:MAG TPA: helix-turn-helix domain-containing protein [Gemmatimonadaceae bacterium]|jgi:transcriptional regulator with XRE-family HTH domain|nr:helix-turn-helix domain-containing protein [Gemmatimonadaceae bacterium]